MRFYKMISSFSRLHPTKIDAYLFSCSMLSKHRFAEYPHLQCCVRGEGIILFGQCVCNGIISISIVTNNNDFALENLCAFEWFWSQSEKNMDEEKLKKILKNEMERILRGNHKFLFHSIRITITILQSQCNMVFLALLVDFS